MQQLGPILSNVALNEFLNDAKESLFAIIGGHNDERICGQSISRFYFYRKFFFSMFIYLSFLLSAKIAELSDHLKLRR